jgi:hypothetical protein
MAAFAAESASACLPSVPRAMDWAICACPLISGSAGGEFASGSRIASASSSALWAEPELLFVRRRSAGRMRPIEDGTRLVEIRLPGQR